MIQDGVRFSLRWPRWFCLGGEQNPLPDSVPANTPVRYWCRSWCMGSFDAWLTWRAKVVLPAWRGLASICKKRRFSLSRFSSSSWSGWRVIQFTQYAELNYSMPRKGQILLNRSRWRQNNCPSTAWLPTMTNSDAPVNTEMLDHGAQASRKGRVLPPGEPFASANFRNMLWDRWLRISADGGSRGMGS